MTSLLRGRAWVAAACLLLAASGATPGWPASPAAPAARASAEATDAAQDAVRAFVEEFYRTFSSSGDAARYRALLAPGYLLIEDGKVLDADEDVAGMPKPGTGPRRTDAFEFRQIQVRGTTAHAVYRLRSTIVDGGTTREKAWTESMVLHRIGGRWRAALIHSTTIGLR